MVASIPEIDAIHRSVDEKSPLRQDLSVDENRTVHEYFDDLADAMIVSNRPGGKVSRQLLGEVLSRVAVKTPPEATR